MALKIFNTLTRKKEEFKPLKEGKAGIYSCGPTVYNYVHIGNLRAYIAVDLLKRYLKYKGYDVMHVMNLTDVDDKTIRNSKAEGKSLKEFTEFYTEKFMEDLKALNIQKADVFPKATEHINEMVEIIKKLKENGIAYESGGSWYFKISEFKDYGKLAKLDFADLMQNADKRLDASDEYDKDDARDFALWKGYDEKEDGQVFWETELGKGRPGWHIECSAMSMKYLGETFDIHTGGVDLIFPHHENEIAQSECATGRKFVNYWFHNAHLIVNGEKMSKSLGNFFTMPDLLNKGYSAKAIRYELLSTHYRTQLDFKEENLEKIPATLQKFYDFLGKLGEVDNPGSDEETKGQVEELTAKAKYEFERCMDDDLNISGGLAAVFEFMTGINKVMDALDANDAKSVKAAMDGFDSVLGVMQHEKAEIPAEIQEKAELREKARNEKDFAAADKIRNELKKLGYVIEDTAKGPRVKAE